MTLGQRVERRRKMLRMSQAELARRAGITQSLLSRIESGHHGNPGANALKGLARALQCSIDYLVGMYDDDPADASAALVAVSSP